MNKIPTLAECKASKQAFDYLLWVGCAGSYDDRYQRMMRSLTRLLDRAGVRYAILGEEESCTGDPAKRAGNEFLFQMQATANIERLNGYGVRRIVTGCPHCFNALKNEYGALGGHYEVLHHSTLLWRLIREGKLRVKPEKASSSVTYHDPCYLGRGAGNYEAPRALLRMLFADFREMRHHRSKSRCCGAGGAQMFKESEPHRDEIHHLRSKEALDTGAKHVAVACPFCMLMFRDGIKERAEAEGKEVHDLSELLLARLEAQEQEISTQAKGLISSNTHVH